MRLTDAPCVLILAAGRGRRLGPDAPDLPKILLEFDGKSLLERHLERLDRAGAGPVHLVVGYEAGKIEAALDRLGRRADVTLLHNPDWRQGSVVSLDCGRAVLEQGAPVLLMDADVIYPQALIDRLLASRHEAALLLDRELEPGDEPVKICVAATPDGRERIVDFAKRPEAAHDWHGESVGFFRFAPPVARALAGLASAACAGDGRMLEYEEPIRALIRAEAAEGGPPRFGFEDITGLPWTEIDFMDDIEKARALLPLLSEHAS